VAVWDGMILKLKQALTAFACCLSASGGATSTAVTAQRFCGLVAHCGRTWSGFGYAISRKIALKL